MGSCKKVTLLRGFAKVSLTVFVAFSSFLKASTDNKSSVQVKLYSSCNMENEILKYEYELHVKVDHVLKLSSIVKWCVVMFMMQQPHPVSTDHTAGNFSTIAFKSIYICTGDVLPILPSIT